MSILDKKDAPEKPWDTMTYKTFNLIIEPFPKNILDMQCCVSKTPVISPQ